MRRAQVSFEFLMISGIALTLLAASAFFMFEYTQKSSEQSAMQRAAQLGYQLVDEAKNVYVFGEGSFVNIEASMPQELKEVYTVEDDTLVFKLDTRNGEVDIPIFSDIPINGTFIDGQKTHVNTPPILIHQGRTTYHVESMGTWVEISQIT